MKLSLYLPISIASSHSPTELKDGKAEKVRWVRGMAVPRDLPTERDGERGAGHGAAEQGTAERAKPEVSPGAGGAGALRGLQALQHLGQDVVDVRELGSLAAVLLPAVEHQLVQGRLAVCRGGQAEPVLHGLQHLRWHRRAGDGSGAAMQIIGKRLGQTSLPTARPGSSSSSLPHTISNGNVTGSPTTARTHILVGHVPVGPLSVGHDFPHDDAEAPDVAGRAEVVIPDGFGGRPQHQALPPLQGRGEMTHSHTRFLDGCSSGPPRHRRVDTEQAHVPHAGLLPRKLLPESVLKWLCNPMLHGSESPEILMGEENVSGKS